MRRLRLDTVLLALAMWLSASAADAFSIDRVVSPGGIVAWLIQDHHIPVVSIQFAFAGGSAQDAPAQGGRARMVASLLDEGAGPYDSEAFQKILADRTIGLGFEAGTDAFYGSLKYLVEDEAKATELMRLSLTEPRFDAEAVARMRAALLVRLKQLQSNPDAIAQRAFYANAFPDHPYGRTGHGTVASLNSLTPDDLRRFVAQRFGRDDLTIGVTGDIAPARLGALLDRLFGSLPAQASEAPIADRTPDGAGQTLLVAQPSAQSVVLVGQAGLKRDDPDWYAGLVMNYVLGGGGFGSRLMSAIREQRGLSYGVYSDLVAFDHAGLITAGGSTANAHAGQVVDLIKAQWRQLAEHGVTQQELDDAKTYLTGSFPLRFTSSDRIAEVLLQVQREHLGIDYLDRHDALIQRVTLDDVNRAARRLLDPARLLIVVVGEPAGITPTRQVEPGGG